ncbi:MarC family protein [Microbulbifer yueqingensis]|uniref:UPF0056 membrane protein n=1 Tax=Microbulbifer yueqingensis TaxID=658219 RepID=A0A1G8X2C3_9GAMM|nr:MarC family protein [Microbulbifer yueqingensis]SDJ84487.1 multiple antibiotic resistance protein [Microbulbifer yueqingensis]
MTTAQFMESFLLLLVLLNPFIFSVYVLDLFRGLGLRALTGVLFRAYMISLCLFLLFAWFGEQIFDDVLQVRFLAFLIFGGITFLIIGIRLTLNLGSAIESKNLHPEEAAGSIAMPFIIGPGTISASVVAGSRLGTLNGSLAIILAMATALGSLILLKVVYDWVQNRQERYVRRYVEVAGRVTAMFTGSFAVDMILKGIERWLELPG